MRRSTGSRAWMGVAMGVLLSLGGCAGDETVSFSARSSEGAGARSAAVVVSEERWTFAGRDGSVIRTPHYRLFTTTRDERLRDRAPVFLEHALAHYRSSIVDLPAPPQKLDTYLMDNRPQWVLVTKRLMGDAAEEIEQIQRGGFASRGIGVYWDLGVYDTLAVAAHEGWHQYTQRTFRDPLPVWLEEGLAVYMEGHRWRVREPRFVPWANVERFDRLRELVRDDRLVPLPELLEMAPNDHLADTGGALLDFYAQVWALTHFLKEGSEGRYRVGLGRLLRDAQSGELRVALGARLGPGAGAAALASRRGPAVFEAYVDEDLASAGLAFEAFCRDVTRTGAREAIAVGRSPVVGID
jgi:hypothetical protein